ncbi:transposase [Streptomyces sp. R11]|uniref:Transposase n=1 Tax=Streptomyces sp. R11 TaxID=3238625 RepID=A0AB39NCV8_9ACTN
MPWAPSRPEGGGRRRHGDQEVLAAIVFGATSGCTWQQLPTASLSGPVCPCPSESRAPTSTTAKP